VIEKQPVEENLVGILQRSQVDVAFQRILFSLKCAISTDHLLIESFGVRRQKPVQAKLGSLVIGKRRTLVQGLVAQQVYASQGWLHIVHFSNRVRTALTPGTAAYPESVQWFPRIIPNTA
jgi:hypothetical protein